MKTLVTGGAGFIGSHLADELIKRKHEVVILDNLSDGKLENINKKAKFYKINICQNLEQIFKKYKPEIVFHLAAQKNVRKSLEDPVKDARVNILGTLNILKNKAYFKKFIFSSSGGAIYGDAQKIPTPENYPANPLSPYGVSKLAIEKYLKALNINAVSLRYSNVYGPRQDAKGEAGVVAIFIDKIKNNQTPIIFGTGNQTRDYVHVFDAVSANIKAINKKISGEFNIGTSQETSVNALLRLLAPCAQVKYIDAVPGEVMRSCLDIKKANSLLNWQPKINLKQGLNLTATSTKAQI